MTLFATLVLPADVHANRPASAKKGTLFPCTTHNTIDQWNGSAWSTWATLGSSGIVQAVVAGTNVTVDSTDPTHPIVAASGGGATTETYDAAVTAALTGVVHRWKFTETSGTSVADSVGSLTGTLSGTVTRNVTGKIDKATTFGASAKMITSGLGSIPVGAASRCFIVVYRTTSDTTAQTLLSYGTNSTRTWWDAEINITTAGNISLSTWSDDFAPAVKCPVSGPELTAASGRDWHLAAYGYNTNTQEVYVYQDGVMWSKLLGGAAATASSGNFQIGFPVVSGSSQFSGDIDDVLVTTTWPGKSVLDRLLAAAAGVPSLH